MFLLLASMSFLQVSLYVLECVRGLRGICKWRDKVSCNLVILQASRRSTNATTGRWPSDRREASFTWWTSFCRFPKTLSTKTSPSR